VVLRLDEASFLGARQAGALLRIVEELQERGVQAKLHLLGDTHQAHAGYFRRGRVELSGARAGAPGEFG
jgi:hypothetical protein